MELVLFPSWEKICIVVRSFHPKNSRVLCPFLKKFALAPNSAQASLAHSCFDDRKCFAFALRASEERAEPEVEDKSEAGDSQTLKILRTIKTHWVRI